MESIYQCLDQDIELTKEDICKTVKQMRKEMGMTQAEFGAYYGVPVRTVKAWEKGECHMPAYTLRLMLYRARMEQKLQKQYKQSDGNATRCYQMLLNATRYQL